MALEIDGFAVFAAIGANRALFGDLAAEIDKTARALVLKQLKRKPFAVADLRALRAGLGAETLALILDPLSDADISAVLAKCDSHNAAAIKSATPGWRRTHLEALAAGEVEPAPATKAKGGAKAPKSGAPAKPPRPEAKPGLSYASAGRVRKAAR